MDIIDLCRFGYYVALLAGIAGGCFAYAFRPSGKRALAIALVPLGVVMARVAVITMARWSDINGMEHLFC
jgi:hypothetical protein